MGNKLLGINLWNRSKEPSRKTVEGSPIERKEAEQVDFRQEELRDILLRKRKFIFTTKEGFLLVDTHGHTQEYPVTWGEYRIENPNFVPFSPTILIVNGAPRELIQIDINPKSGTARVSRRVLIDKEITRIVVDGEKGGKWAYGIMERMLFKMETNLVSKPKKSEVQLYGEIVDNPVPVGDKIAVLRRCQGQKEREGETERTANHSYLSLFDRNIEKGLPSDLDLGSRLHVEGTSPKYYSKLKRLDDSRLLIASNAHDFCVLNMSRDRGRGWEWKFFNLDSEKHGEIYDIEGFGNSVVIVTWHTRHYHVTVFRLDDKKLEKGVEIIATHSPPHLCLLSEDRVVVMDTSAFTLWHLDFPQEKARALLAVPLRLGSLIVSNFPLSQNEERQETKRFTEELENTVIQVPKTLLHVIANFI